MIARAMSRPSSPRTIVSAAGDGRIASASRDDLALATCQHMRDHRVDRVHRPEKIDVDDPLNGVGRVITGLLVVAPDAVEVPQEHAVPFVLGQHVIGELTVMNGGSLDRGAARVR